MLPIEKLARQIQENPAQKTIAKNTKNFIKALNKGQTKAALKWLSQGIDLDGNNKNGDNFLTIAAQKGNIKIAEALIKRGLDPFSSFLQSVDKNYQKAVKFLLENTDVSKNLDDFNLEGQTALMIAADNNNANMIKLLLNNGADLEESASFLYKKGDLIDASFLLQTSNYPEIQEGQMWKSLAEQHLNLYDPNRLTNIKIGNDENNLDQYLVTTLFPMVSQESPYFTVTPIAGSFSYTPPPGQDWLPGDW